MDQKVMTLTYASSLTKLCEVNHSFDQGLLRIAYAGENQNGTYISKETFEKCIKTIFNCPVVCHYDRESDTIGGHDMDIVETSEGKLELVALTQPVGCVPESSRVFWQKVTEEDGTEREYLCAEVLLWKRQEAYRKIKEDGVVAQSMEIAINDGEQEEDGLYHIYEFTFTAFALIGVAPCFESASLEVFAKRQFTEQFSMMMCELKECLQSVNPSQSEDDNKNDYATEGGEKVLDNKELFVNTTVMAENPVAEEAEAEGTVIESYQAEPDKAAGESAEFALTENIRDEIIRVLSEIKIETEWGKYPRYCLVDFDIERKEIYCWDYIDWLLYGFVYEMDGDRVIIDFESKKRKKYEIVDFDEGEQESPFAEVFAQMEQKIHDNAEWEAKYQTASDRMASMESELEALRQFKAEIELANATSERESLFAKFADLVGNEAFEELVAQSAEYDMETLEEKCYALRGRQSNVAKFALEPNKVVKLKIEKTETASMPYGGIFEKYGFSSEN